MRVRYLIISVVVVVIVRMDWIWLVLVALVLVHFFEDFILTWGVLNLLKHIKIMSNLVETINIIFGRLVYF